MMGSRTPHGSKFGWIQDESILHWMWIWWILSLSLSLRAQGLWILVIGRPSTQDVSVPSPGILVLNFRRETDDCHHKSSFLELIKHLNNSNLHDMPSLNAYEVTVVIGIIGGLPRKPIRLFLGEDFRWHTFNPLLGGAWAQRFHMFQSLSWISSLFKANLTQTFLLLNWVPGAASSAAGRAAAWRPRCGAPCTAGTPAGWTAAPWTEAAKWNLKVMTKFNVFEWPSRSYLRFKQCL